ncbi:MAG: DEAD/DEAH box helicase [Victivallaceae bacterium]
MITALRNKIRSLFAGSAGKTEKRPGTTVEPVAVSKPHVAAPRKKHPQHNEKRANSGEKRSYQDKRASSFNQNISDIDDRKPRRKPVSAGKERQQRLPVFDQKPKEIPPKPEKLIEPPVVEGKTRFMDMNVHQDIMFGVQEMGFEYCTPIQEASLPHLLAGSDLAGKAQTGTGKTAAFLVSTFTKLLNNPKENRLPGSCRALVMAPTRELAIQIHKDAERIALFAGMHNVVVFGGMDHHKQREMLARPVDILIGTPGRIIDYSRSRHLDLSHAEVLIIDEADRMLDMGFIPDVTRIINQLPGKGKRQTMLFSATLDPSILQLADNWLREPVTVESESEQMITDLIEQCFYSVSADEKLPVLLWMLQHEDYERILIFGNRKDKNMDLQRNLARYGVKVELLSGDIAQEKRIKILERFREGSVKVVIATDVAARGIHVDNVTMVINYDLPERAEDYVHRVGRTGRAGQKGKSVSFLCEYGAYYLPEIEKLLNCHTSSTLPPEEMLVMPAKDADYREPARQFRSDRPSFSSGRRPSSGGRGGRSSSRSR